MGGWKEEGVLAQGAARHSLLNQVISHDSGEKRKICVDPYEEI